MTNRALQGCLWGLLIILLVACNASSDSSVDTSNTPSIGQFVDEPVGGLTYKCGRFLNTTSGITNSLGQFQYYPGQSCTFSIGNVTVGTVATVPSDGKVTPQDIAGVQRTATNDPTVVAITQFLQSLNDGTVSGAIHIPASIITKLSDSSVASISLVTSDGPINQDILAILVGTIAGVPLVSPTQASAHLRTQMSDAGINTAIGTVTSADSPKLHSIAVSLSLDSSAAGLTEQLVATGYFTDGARIVITNLVSWTSSSSAIASVETATGLVTGISPGTTTLTATLGSISGSRTLTVTAPVTPIVVAPIVVTPIVVAPIVFTPLVDTPIVVVTLSSISLAPATSSVIVGATDQITAIGNYSDGTAQNLTSWVTWGSTSGATITTAGLLTGVAGGTNATITATMSGISQSVVVPVRLPGGIATTASISVVTSN